MKPPTFPRQTQRPIKVPLGTQCCWSCRFFQEDGEPPPGWGACRRRAGGPECKADDGWCGDWQGHKMVTAAESPKESVEQ